MNDVAPVDRDERAALVELHHRVGGDSVRLWPRLLQAGSARKALQALPPEQPRLPGLENEARATKCVTDPGAVLRRCGAYPVVWTDPEYPPRLRLRDHPPPVLYVRGRLCEADAHGVAIVGSRRASRRACHLAFEIARDLAAHGITVVSGLAHGVDTAAHLGALSAGRTIAVIGTGIDVTYPRSNRALAARIAENGAVLTQFSCGSPPLAYHFPLRNDTLARLVQAVVVVEAPARSGALVTAERAAHHGVDVMACPGDAGRPSCAGSNGLLKDGAILVESARDILEALDWLPQRQEIAVSREPAPTAQGEHGELLRLLAGEWATADELAERSGKSMAEVRSALTQLELAGRVVRLEGDRYRPV